MTQSDSIAAGPGQAAGSGRPAESGSVRSPLRRRLGSVAVAAALLGGATAPAVLLAPVAAAHSVLLSVDPQDGSQLDASPEEIVLTFNEEVNQNFASVAVTAGDDRTNRVTGEPVVEGDTVTARVDDLAPGAYTVGYRVTSADGHVVSGSSVFTVAGDAGDATGGEDGTAPAGTTPAGTAAPGAEAGGAEAGGESADATEADVADETSGESSGINPVIWVIGGLAVLLIGGAFVLLRRGGGN